MAQSLPLPFPDDPEPPRTCPCGCGGTPPSGKTWIIGHNVRVLERDLTTSTWQLAPRVTIPCGLEGCPTLITARESAKRKYCSQAHANAARMQAAERTPPRRCQLDGCDTVLLPGQDRFCTPKHARVAQRTIKRHPTNPFAQFIFDQWKNSRQTQREYSATVGISRPSLRRLLLGGCPSAENLAALRAHFGESLPITRTAQEVRHALGLAAMERRFPEEGDWEKWRHDVESQRRAGLSAPPKTKASARKRSARALASAATRRTRGTDKRIGERARQVSQRWEVQARRWLGKRLKRDFGSLEAQAVAREAIQEQLPSLANDYAERSGREVPVVLAAWQSLLERRGLSEQPPTMSQASQKRVPVLLAILAKTIWQPGDPSFPRGFADEFAVALINAKLGRHRSDALRVWANTHRTTIEAAARSHSHWQPPLS
jgi:hypothetical protein